MRTVLFLTVTLIVSCGPQGGWSSGDIANYQSTCRGLGYTQIACTCSFKTAYKKYSADEFFVHAESFISEMYERNEVGPCK